MKFGKIPVADAEGVILAHSARLKERTLKKGRALSADDITLLREAGREDVIGAKLEPDDVGEDDAAASVAAMLVGENLRVGDAFTGRCNLFAKTHGVIAIDRARLDALNLIDEAVTVATVTPYNVVTPDQMVATIKIIPFAITGEVLKRVTELLTAEPLMSVASFQKKSVGLVLSRLPGMKESILDGTVKTISARVEDCGSRIVAELRCDHEQDKIAGAIKELLAHKLDLVLVFGASATVDRLDVVPAAVVYAGGDIRHFGMPVDPGNLLFMGNIGNTPVIGMPGCARSPALNGVDWVLWRVLADLEVTAQDIMVMGAGGLLKEMAERPQPRRAREGTNGLALAREPKIAALLLAAGSGTRMGKVNKMMAPVRGRAMITWAADAILASKATSLIVVTGHEPEKVKEVLEDYPASFVYNPNYVDGLSTSLRVGIASLPNDADGVIVCLGDMPEVKPETINSLIRAFDPVEGRAICVPVHGRKRGNPVLLAKAYFDEITRIDGDVGARSLIEEHDDEVFEIEIDDDSILFDIDTPDGLDKFHTKIVVN